MVLCVGYPPHQRPLPESPCMIVMPQLYQHEILIRAHNALGHRSNVKVLARIPEPKLTAEVSNEFMRASQVTKLPLEWVTSTPKALQNRTLLTLLRVFCSRRLRDWDQHLEEVMGAYNSTRPATTGFSPYMMTRGTEKAIFSLICILSWHPDHLKHMVPRWSLFFLGHKRSKTWCVELRIRRNYVRG